MDTRVQKTLEQVSDQTLNINPDADFNIVLVGMTGAGKSYFANALLGSLTPGYSEGVSFLFLLLKFFHDSTEKLKIS